MKARATKSPRSSNAIAEILYLDLLCAAFFFNRSMMKSNELLDNLGKFLISHMKNGAHFMNWSWNFLRASSSFLLWNGAVVTCQVSVSM